MINIWNSPLTWILGIILLSVIVWILTKTFQKKNRRDLMYSRKTALDILTERLDRGEISQKQYEQMKEDITTTIKK